VVRKQACWSWFADGYHTYGNGNVWHFDSLKAEFTQSWKEAPRSPGAASLRHVRQFLDAARWWTLVPDHSLFIEGQGSGAKLNVAMRSAETNAVAVYLSSPASIKLDLRKLSGKGKL